MSKGIAFIMLLMVPALWAAEGFRPIQKKRIVKSCLSIHQDFKNKKEICHCIVNNLDSFVGREEARFLTKYYKKKTQMECGTEDALCSFNYSIVSACHKDIHYRLDSKKDTIHCD